MRSTRLTRDGAGVAAGSVLLYAAGVLLGYPLLIAIAAGGLAMLAGAVVSVTLRPRVELSRRLARDRVTAGEPVRCSVLAHNPSRWPAPRFSATDRVAGVEQEIRFRGLAPNGRHHENYEIPAPRRGRFPVGPLTVLRTDPLGLLRRAQSQTGDDVVWVHPRVHTVPALPVGVVLEYEGRVSDDARLGALTFASLRDYVPGDDPRRIHWRTTARTGTLVVREHVDTTEPMTTVLLDTRSVALDPMAFEEAVQAAASVVCGTELTGQPVALHILGQDAARSRSLGARSHLDRLAAAEQCRDSDPAGLLRAAENSNPGGALVVITGGQEPGVVVRVAEQRRRFNPVVVITVLNHPAAVPYLRRSPGMAVLACRTAAEAAEAWTRMAGGETG
jgi:uncharacterized protein (DUF58 family)